MADMFGPVTALRRNERDNRYVIALAGGDGRRLAEIAEQTYGYPRPKQYCSFGGSSTLLDQTLHRAIRFTGTSARVVVSTSRVHAREAKESLARWPGVRQVEQPRNLDTTPGLLLPLLEILTRDPCAWVLVLPSDHYVSDDERFVNTLLESMDSLEADPDTVLLVGAQLPAPERDLGWIVPGASAGGWRHVVRFAEKPADEDTVALHRSGALANTFVVLGRGAAIAQLIRRHTPQWWKALTNAYFKPDSLEGVYERMPPSSFSRDVLQQAVTSLGVLPLQGVEWSDVGTPERLMRISSARSAA
jgi:mannose-1-phosphate guanylyltransferase